MVENQCLYCDCRFTRQLKMKTPFCSKACREAYFTRECECCRKPFRIKKTRLGEYQKTCSKRCGYKVRKRRAVPSSWERALHLKWFNAGRRQARKRKRQLNPWYRKMSNVIATMRVRPNAKVAKKTKPPTSFESAIKLSLGRVKERSWRHNLSDWERVLKNRVNSLRRRRRRFLEHGKADGKNKRTLGSAGKTAVQMRFEWNSTASRNCGS